MNLFSTHMKEIMQFHSVPHLFHLTLYSPKSFLLSQMTGFGSLFLFLRLSSIIYSDLSIHQWTDTLLNSTIDFSQFLRLLEMAQLSLKTMDFIFL